MPRRKRHFLINRDRNLEAMYSAGREARDQGEPLIAGPQLLEAMRDDEQRALQFIAQWRRGWLQKDYELRAMKGTD